MKASPKKRYYGKYKEVISVPNLIELQLRAYEDFLQMKVPYICREDKGLESIIRKVFPIKNIDGKISLEYLHYELGKPRYTPDECRKLKLTYGSPFNIRVRLNIEDRDPIEDDVYLGEIPIMIGGGEFIINGAERVIVSQLHRSPGIDFDEEKHSGEKHLQKCWIIPERGSWIEVNVTKKETLVIRIDQSGKIPITIFIRAMSPDYSTDEAIIKLFYETEVISLKNSKASKKLAQRILAASIEMKDAIEQGKVLHIPAGTSLTDDLIEKICDSDLKSVTVIKDKKNKVDPLILKTLEEDPTSDLKRNKDKEPDGYVAALARIFARLRPGTPFNLERAKNLFFEKFYDPARYRLGPVGRFRLNRKFGQQVNMGEMVLTPEDIFNSVRYIFKLRKNEGEIDDIDHLGNRRVRTIVELAGDEFYKGFLKLNRTIKERMNMETEETLSPKNLINSKTISSAVDYFFGRGELSQVVDQTNPLAQLTHERRLSALGPGGLNRKRAGFEVRDVHISHYGRICPIETPEGTNIGLISSLAIYTTIDEYGFLVSPYLVAKNGKVTKEIKYLRADEEHNKIIAPADSIDADGNFHVDNVIVRVNGDYQHIAKEKIDYCDISPKQMVGVSASLIPFLENNDANRALMGSNMQRQAVPLLVTEAPIVSTGMEGAVAQNSSMVICSEVDGVIKSSTAERIIVKSNETDEEFTYVLRKFVGLNERTCLNQKPIVKAGDKVKKIK